MSILIGDKTTPPVITNPKDYYLSVAPLLHGEAQTSTSVSPHREHEILTVERLIKVHKLTYFKLFIITSIRSTFIMTEAV